MQFDSTGIKSSKDISFGGRPKAGQYHLYVETCEQDEPGPDGKIEAMFRVKGGTVSGQEGKTFYHTFWNAEYQSEEDKDAGKPKEANRFTMSFGLCTGVLKPNQGGQTPDWSEAEGSHVIGTVEKYKYKSQGEEKEGTRIKFGEIWAMDDPDVSEVPRGDMNSKPKAQAAATTNVNSL